MNLQPSGMFFVPLCVPCGSPAGGSQASTPISHHQYVKRDLVPTGIKECSDNGGGKKTEARKGIEPNLIHLSLIWVHLGQSFSGGEQEQRVFGNIHTAPPSFTVWRVH